MSVPLWTVTTDKTLYITDISISTDNPNIKEALIQAAASNIFREFVRDLAPIQMPGLESQPSASSAQAVNLIIQQTAAAHLCDYSIYGFEQ